MNTRIRQLALQANLRAFINLDGSLTPELHYFAETIVQECMLQCHHNDDMDRIEKHFGVEE